MMDERIKDLTAVSMDNVILCQLLGYRSFFEKSV
jgi:hypothetical protein